VTLQLIPQGRKMLFDDGIERRVLRLMALVAAACADGPVAGNSFHRTMMAGQGGPSQRSIARICVRFASQSHAASAVLAREPYQFLTALRGGIFGGISGV